MAKDYYQILGVSKNASADEIKRAYRKLAHQHHPDKDAGNEEKFKEINQAYQALGNEEKRKMYDQFGSNYEQVKNSGGQGNPFSGFDFSGFSGQGGPGMGWDFNGAVDLGDIFSDFFGGRAQSRSSRRNRGIDLEMGLQIEFKEAVFGTQKEISLEKQDVCEVCKGSGAAENSQIITCKKCGGKGQVVTAKRTIFGTVQSRTTCDACEGSGQVPEQECAVCRGSGAVKRKSVMAVKIPAGIDSGQRIRVAGGGEAGYRGMGKGDLFLVIKVKEDNNFERDGVNLFTQIPVSFIQATLGAKSIIQTLDGEIELKIPAGTQPGTIFKVKNKGVPNLDNPNRRGDLFVTARVVVPNKVSKKEKDLLEKLAEESGESVQVEEGLWNEIKDSFG